MNTIYEIKPHKDGYVVIERSAAVGISTHADLLDAIETCRAANRFVRSITTKERNVCTSN